MGEIMGEIGDSDYSADEHQLVTLARAGHVAHIAELLQDYGDDAELEALREDALSLSGDSALLIACRSGHREAAKLLLEVGFKPDISRHLPMY